MSENWELPRVRHLEFLSGLQISLVAKGLGISPALLRLFPNFFLWYVGTTRQDLFTVVCMERHDVSFS